MNIGSELDILGDSPVKPRQLDELSLSPQELLCLRSQNVSSTSTLMPEPGRRQTNPRSSALLSDDHEHLPLLLLQLLAFSFSLLFVTVCS